MAVRYATMLGASSFNIRLRISSGLDTLIRLVLWQEFLHSSDTDSRWRTDWVWLFLQCGTVGRVSALVKTDWNGLLQISALLPLSLWSWLLSFRRYISNVQFLRFYVPPERFLVFAIQAIIWMLSTKLHSVFHNDVCIIALASRYFLQSSTLLVDPALKYRWFLCLIPLFIQGSCASGWILWWYVVIYYPIYVVGE